MVYFKTPKNADKFLEITKKWKFHKEMGTQHQKSNLGLIWYSKRVSSEVVQFERLTEMQETSLGLVSWVRRDTACKGREAVEGKNRTHFLEVELETKRSPEKQEHVV